MTKETLISWQKEEGHSNEWLAEECGVKPSTVSSWRSDRPIPSKAILIIENLIAIDRAKKETASQTPQNLVLDFSQEEFDTICHAAASESQIPRVWAKRMINDLSKLSPAGIADLADLIKNDQGSPGLNSLPDIDDGKSSHSGQG